MKAKFLYGDFIMEREVADSYATAGIHSEGIKVGPPPVIYKISPEHYKHANHIQLEGKPLTSSDVITELKFVLDFVHPEVIKHKGRWLLQPVAYYTYTK